MVNTAAANALAVQPGDAVRARRTIWHVSAVHHDDRVSLLRLQPADDRARADRTLVSPFDRLEPVAGRHRPVRVSRRRAMRALAELVVGSPPEGVPAFATGDEPALFPFQLEPLLALRNGLAARVLIADHVGLGKTIQAAFIARDLLAAQPGAAILIVTPAGLREQWQAELRDRTGLDAVLFDADSLRARSAALPPDINPWRTASIAIVSIDFVKQSEVVHGLRSLVWDLLIVDEAHLLTPGSDRLAAGRALASRSARVVLLTATPHDGETARFETLCGLGQLGASDVVAVFRRTRAAGGVRPRRLTRRIAVQPSPAERRLHALLERYARRVWVEAPASGRGAARLAMTVLFKRAASSPASLVRSLERRRAWLAAIPDEPPRQAHLPLSPAGPGHEPGAHPLDDDAAPDAVLAAPGLEFARERTWLNLLIHAGVEAMAEDRKLRALTRLIRRVREPVIVFTEYRDTLDRVEAALGRVAAVAAIHGGRTLDARADALRAFDSGAVRVLVATDAASEGLNLQRRCRTVVQVELPWSPTRLEQRVGRVDRLGQARSVHSIQLLSRHTVEARIEARLAARAQRIREALGEDDETVEILDPVAALDGALAGGAPREAEDEAPRRVTRSAATVWPTLGAEADAAVRWLASARRLRQARVSGRARGSRSRHGVLVARVRRAARRWRSLERGWLLVYHTRLSCAGSRPVEQALVPLHICGSAVGAVGDGLLPASFRTLDEMLRAHAARLALAHAHEWRSIDPGASPVARRRAAIAVHDRAAATARQLPLFADPATVASDVGHGDGTTCGSDGEAPGGTAAALVDAAFVGAAPTEGASIDVSPTVEARLAVVLALR